MKSHIFVDGENFRYSLNQLFEDESTKKTGFNRQDYLPKNANWSKFFTTISDKLNTELLRTNWYVVEHIDYKPWDVKPIPEDIKSTQGSEILRDSRQFLKKGKFNFDKNPDKNPDEELALIRKKVDDLLKTQKTLKNRSDRRRSIQNKMQNSCDRLDFVRSGSIRYNLFKKEFGTEKGVDTQLATDLITLAPTYDMAVIISGDADYLPPINAIKRMGKIVTSVSFLTRNKKILPGGAFRLETAVDHALKLEYEEMTELMNLST